MHIVYVSPYFDPATQYGGVVTQLRALCEALAERGHRIDVVTSDAGIRGKVSTNCWHERESYRVYYASAGRIGSTPPYWLPAAAKEIRRLAPQADLFDCQVSFNHLNILTRRYCFDSGTPYVYTPRSCLDPVRLRQRAWSKCFFLRLFERRIINHATIIRSLSEKEKQQVIAQGATPSKIRVLPNGVQPAPQIDSAQGSVFRKRLGIPEDVTLVLFLGRLQRVKGLDLLVRAFTNADVKNAHLVIAGPDEGEQANIAVQADTLGIGDRVHLPGPQYGENKEAAFAAADLFALTSYSEGMPNAVLEAAARGLPMLITDACNLPQVNAYDAGLITPAQTEAVSRAMQDLLNDANLRDKQGRQARTMIEKEFTINAIAKQLEQMYIDMVS